jgi:electron transfer flavoprotein alpha subunit
MHSTDAQEHAGVWVYLQHRDRAIVEPSLELLGKARDLARQLRAQVAGIMAGDALEPAAAQALQYGADTVYVLRSPLLRNYTTCAYAQVLCGLVAEQKPAIFLMAATPQGRDLAPRIASSLRVGLTADCTDLQIGSFVDPKTKESRSNILLQIRPAWGGNIIATIVNPDTRPQMATVREGILKLPQPNPDARGEIITREITLPESAVRTAVLRQELTGHTVNLKAAKIIVAGGAGLGSRESFNLIRQLAHLLGAEIGATRAAVDAGYIGHDHQVGQTGITVRPKLYIACGISGAVQHLAGMDESQKIVAINTDAGAPVFKVAHYGIVGDVREVLPRLITTYKKLSH